MLPHEVTVDVAIEECAYPLAGGRAFETVGSERLCVGRQAGRRCSRGYECFRVDGTPGVPGASAQDTPHDPRAKLPRTGPQHCPFVTAFVTPPLKRLEQHAAQEFFGDLATARLRAEKRIETRQGVLVDFLERSAAKRLRSAHSDVTRETVGETSRRYRH